MSIYRTPRKEPNVGWITISNSNSPHSGRTLEIRHSIYMSGWAWSDEYRRWFVPYEYTLATPSEILKAKLLGE